MSSYQKLLFMTGVSEQVETQSPTSRKWNLGVEYEDALINTARDSVGTS